jgi:hypothetical protein
MTEERKHAILFAATLLSARKIIDALDSSKPNPGKDFFIDKAIKEAAAILEKIDQRWPSVSRIVCSTCSGHNEFAIRAGPSGIGRRYLINSPMLPGLKKNKDGSYSAIRFPGKSNLRDFEVEGHSLLEARKKLVCRAVVAFSRGLP